MNELLSESYTVWKHFAWYTPQINPDDEVLPQRAMTICWKFICVYGALIVWRLSTDGTKSPAIAANNDQMQACPARGADSWRRAMSVAFHWSIGLITWYLSTRTWRCLHSPSGQLDEWHLTANSEKALLKAVTPIRVIQPWTTLICLSSLWL